MAGLLAAFLRESTARRWQWGVTDCLMWPADWVKRVRGEDPAAMWRGKYSTALACARIVQANGGVMKLCGAGCASVGMGRTAYPEAGDIAVVRAPVRDGARIRVREMGAVVVSAKDVAVMTEDLGIVVSSIGFEPVAYWRIG